MLFLENLLESIFISKEKINIILKSKARKTGYKDNLGY